MEKALQLGAKVALWANEGANKREKLALLQIIADRHGPLRPAAGDVAAYVDAAADAAERRKRLAATKALANMLTELVGEAAGGESVGVQNLIRDLNKMSAKRAPQSPGNSVPAKVRSGEVKACLIEIAQDLASGLSADAIAEKLNGNSNLRLAELRALASELSDGYSRPKTKAQAIRQVKAYVVQARRSEMKRNIISKLTGDA